MAGVYLLYVRFNMMIESSAQRKEDLIKTCSSVGPSSDVHGASPMVMVIEFDGFFRHPVQESQTPACATAIPAWQGMETPLLQQSVLDALAETFTHYI